jgi:tRNA-(ms[2]io[6]A)-hydroxylase
MDISFIKAFLTCETPQLWCEKAAANQDILLIDHAHCEKKAASTALMMMFRYAQYEELVLPLSKLAREELRHFEKVCLLMKSRGIALMHLAPARYAEGLRKGAITHEPKRLVDLLIMGAFIEARSCERFASIIPYVDDDLGVFYKSLLMAEARHYQLYLDLARQFSDEDIQPRIDHFRQLENELILSPDEQFRFHSGLPSA